MAKKYKFGISPRESQALSPNIGKAIQAPTGIPNGTNKTIVAQYTDRPAFLSKNRYGIPKNRKTNIEASISTIK